MTTYRAIASTETDPEAPLTSALAKAWAGNVESIAEADPTAPVVQSVWHPYNKVTVGDGNTGQIWSFAVNGAVTTITSPDFVDGYEYAVLFDSILTSGAASNLTINAYRETSAAYAGATNLVGVDNTFPMYGWIELSLVRRALRQHSLFGAARANPSGANSVAAFATTQLAGQQVYHAAAQKLLRVQFALSAAGNITGTGASITLYRRRDIA